MPRKVSIKSLIPVQFFLHSLDNDSKQFKVFKRRTALLSFKTKRHMQIKNF